jgi:AcrR family transcriptional regulator
VSPQARRRSTPRPGPDRDATLDRAHARDVEAAMPAPSRARRPRRTRYHHGDLPRALREAATRLVAERGADGFTLREAARLIGVHHAAAYRHFSDKRALLAAIAEDGYEQLARRMRRADAAAPATDVLARIRRVAAAYVGFARAEPALFALMTGPRLNEDGRFPALERALRAGVDALEAPLRDGRARGTLRDDEPLTMQTLSLLSLIHGYAELVLTRRIHVRPAGVGELLGTLLDPALRGLRAD